MLTPVTAPTGNETQAGAPILCLKRVSTNQRGHNLSADINPARYLEKDWMVAWNLDGDESVKVGPWPDLDGWSQGYSMTAGCCYDHISEMTEEEIGRALVGTALQMLCAGIPAQMLLSEFSQIRIWREMWMDTLEGQYKAFRETHSVTELNLYSP